MQKNKQTNKITHDCKENSGSVLVSMEHQFLPSRICDTVVKQNCQLLFDDCCKHFVILSDFFKHFNTALV